MSQARATNAGVELDEAAVTQLAARLEGEVVAPGADDYDDARSLWNGLVDVRPAVIARCTSREDVAEALAFAREHGLPVAVRGGGHGVAGTALAEGGLVVDLSPLKEITVDPERRTVRAGAGCTLGEVDRATQEHGLAVPFGVVSETGIAGLTLGGGLGWLRRAHGLSSDNLVAAEVVTADGTFLTASESEHPELLWALRGGGGGTAVVTAFEYRLHQVGPEVAVCFVLYPLERAGEVLAGCDAFTRAGNDEMSPIGVLGHVPAADIFPEELHGRPFVAVVAAHPGDPETGARALAPLRELGEPLADLSGTMPYVDAQSLLDEDYPAGGRYYWKSIDLDRLDDEAVAVFVERTLAAPSHHSTVDVWFNGGAMGRVAPDATAFGARPPYLVGVEANWDEGDTAENVAWARETVERLRPFSGGGAYLNFPGFFEEGEALIEASHGAENYRRLRDVRERYDPDGLLRRQGARSAHLGVDGAA